MAKSSTRTRASARLPAASSSGDPGLAPTRNVTDGPALADGALEHAGLSRISGWARAAAGSATCRLRIVDNGRTIAIVDADIYRADLAADGIGDGRYGFDVVVPGGLAPALAHVIEVRHVLSNAVLPGSPAMIPAPALPDSSAGPLGTEPLAIGVPATGASSGGVRGCLDVARRGLIQGWAWNADCPGETLAVQVFVDGWLLCRAVANSLRRDVAACGIGTGRYGFDCSFPAELSPRGRHLVRVCIEQTGQELDGSPCVMEAADALDGTFASTLERAIDALEDPAAQTRTLELLLRQAARLRQAIADRAGQRSERDQGRRRRRIAGPGVTGLPMPRALVITGDAARSGDAIATRVLQAHLTALLQLGYQPSLVADRDFDAADAPDYPVAGVQRWRPPDYASIEEVLRRQADCFDVVYLDGPLLAAQYGSLVRRHMPRARLVLGLPVLAHRHRARQAETQARPELRSQGARERHLACSAAQAADAVLVGSEMDAAVLRAALPHGRIHVVPWVAPWVQSPPQAGTRSPGAPGPDVLFVASGHDEADEDAAAWMLDTLMPLIRHADPRATCTIAGACAGARLRAQPRADVILLPDVHLADLPAHAARIGLAPHRFIGGMSTGLLDSMAASLACVMTATAADGLQLPTALHGLVGSDAATLAGLVVQLHRDPARAAALGNAARHFIHASHGPAAVMPALRAAIDLGIDQPAPAAIVA